MSGHFLLDAGHGGRDPGVVSGPYKESVLALRTVRLVADILTELGYSVTLTRSLDEFVSIADRVRKVGEIRPDCAVSVHYNGADNPGANGTETFYQDWAEPLLAESIQKNLIFLGRRNRGVKKASQTGRGANGFLRGCHNLNVPAALTEPGFMTNPPELNWILDREDSIAQQIAVGIHEWWGGSHVVTVVS